MTTLFNYDPYYDDFDEDKNFMRVLFRPGYSVQARELTQLQTILANQIEKFGNHIFKSGSPIIGGKISLDRKANYVILDPQYNNQDIVVSDFLNKTVVAYNSSKTVRAKVIAVDTTTANPILVVKYLSGDVFEESDEIKIYGQNIFAQAKSTNAVGGSFVASLQEGVYYFKGQFVKVVPQFLVVELFYRVGYGSGTVNTKPSYKIGIEFTEKIIDEIDDTSLLDPAQDAFNYQAPGANRFQIETALSKRTLDSVDTSTFFEIIRIVDDVKTKEIDYAIYSEIEKTLARRTYDESGNYTIDPFIISLEEGDAANGKFNIVLDPGKAYIGGYEFETIAPTTIEVDRAREVSNVTDYDLPTNYESSVVLESVRGTLDISTFPSLDIHSVPHASISFSSTATYNSTKIGTVYADMIRFNDATNNNLGTTHSFTVNTFGANTAPITGTIPASGSSTTTIKIPAAFNASLPLNAYANMYFRITDAGGTGITPILITSSNTTTMNLASALPFAPSSNTISIESDFRNAESLVVSDGTYIAFGGNINSDSKDSVTSWAYVNEPKRSSLVFNTPYSAIKGGSIHNMDFYARKPYYNRTTGAGGSITINAGGTDTFTFSGTPGVISDTQILDNIICFVRSGTTSNSQYGITANTVLSLANNNFTVTAVSPTQFTVNLVVPNVNVDFLITTKVNNAESGANGSTRGKQLIPLTSGVNLHGKVPYEMGGTNTLASANTSGEVTYFSGGSIFTSVGATNFDGASVLTDLRTPGKPVSLQVPDVYEIVAIYDSKNPSANVTTAQLTSAYDITNRYEFDNGQRKSHYDHATIKLKRGNSAPVGRVFVQYKYLKHIPAPAGSGGGLFTVDSYLQTGSNFTYDAIPSFHDPDTTSLYSLRGGFDFRPTRAVGGTSYSGALNPEPYEQVNMDFDYYLGRIDQVVVKQSKEFAVIKGKPAISPLVPPAKQEDMVIYTLAIPAYTETVKDVRADFKNHRRYTMQDIQAFDDRIRGLEYYVSLSNLEKDAASTKVLDANGLERAKYGILVDNFTTTLNQATINDVGFDNRNLVDGGVLYPASLMRTVPLIANTASSTGSTKFVGTGTKKAMMLDYSQKSFVSQPYATKSLPIANALFAGFKGTTRLFPEFTGDVDSETTAKVTLNSTQNIQNAFNFINSAFKYISDNNQQWADDKDSPFAKIADSKWYTTIQQTDTSKAIVESLASWGRPGVWGLNAPINENTYLSAGAELQQKQISTSSSEVARGEFVTDLAIQPYMKPRQVLFSSQGLRPSTTFYSFFDDTDVNAYVVVPNRVVLNTTSGLSAGEIVLISSSTGGLATGLASLLAGGSSYTAGQIVVSENGSANVSIITESGTSLAGKYIYGLDSGATYTISSVSEHKSGVGTTSSNQITLESEASSTNDYYVGQKLHIVKYPNSLETIGETYTITGYVGSTRVATLSGTPSVSTSVVYSIGANKTNKLGQVGGAFYIPKATFRSGQRNFRVTESFNNTYDADALSFADKTYVSSGISLNKTTLVDTVLNVDVDYKIVGNQASDRLMSSRLVGWENLRAWIIVRGGDPLAQTFYVDPQVYPYGVFLSSTDIFFRNKDDENLPVTVQIRPTVNGTPSSDYWYPESVVTKYPSEVNVSEAPNVNDSSTYTRFTFDFPVYLKPGLFALVILTDSPDYTVWDAEKGSTTLNNEFVAAQPYMGTLYKSQNTMEYVPFINEDLMFNINRCVFTTNEATFSLQNETQSTTYNVDKVRYLETSIVPSESVTKLTHSITGTTSLGVKESVTREISPHQVYNYSVDDYYQVGYRRKTLGDQNDFTVNLKMSTTDDTVSPIVSLESTFLNVWENFVDNAEINSEDFTIIAGGAGYSNSNTVTITSSTGTGATANLHVDANGSVLSVYVSNPGSGYLDDFDISYYTHPTTPATIVLNSEYDSAGGPCLARYITKPIKLADGYDAGDLRVFVSANKPQSTEVTVFYKVLSDTDPTLFNDRPYQKMECINPTVTPSLDSSFRDYEYRPSATVNAVTYTGTNGVTYDTFKTFSIKIVLTSGDPAIVPSIKDLRIIATPAE
jgi:hypothetical protein